MSTLGIILLWVIGLLYLLWIVQLTRARKLYAGYAVIWISWSILGLCIISIPDLLHFITNFVGAIYPVSALSLLAFVVLFLIQIYLFSQLSILSRRVMLIAQFIAINEANQHIDVSKSANSNQTI